MRLKLCILFLQIIKMILMFNLSPFPSFTYHILHHAGSLIAHRSHNVQRIDRFPYLHQCQCRVHQYQHTRPPDTGRTVHNDGRIRSTNIPVQKCDKKVEHYKKRNSNKRELSTH